MFVNVIVTVGCLCRFIFPFNGVLVNQRVHQHVRFRISRFKVAGHFSIVVDAPLWVLLVTACDSSGLWLIWVLERPWREIWVWTEVNFFWCLQLKLVVHFIFTYKHFQELRCFSDNEIALVVNIKMIPESRKTVINVCFLLFAFEAEMSCNDLVWNFLHALFSEIELATWKTVTIPSFNCVGFDQWSH